MNGTHTPRCFIDHKPNGITRLRRFALLVLIRSHSSADSAAGKQFSIDFSHFPLWKYSRYILSDSVFRKSLESVTFSECLSINSVRQKVLVSLNSQRERLRSLSQLCSGYDQLLDLCDISTKRHFLSQLPST